MFGWRRKKRGVEVIIDDGDEGEKMIRWVVGEDVDRETYERLKAKREGFTL